MAARIIRPVAAVLCALVALATLAAARPASAQTTALPRPVLLVGGFTGDQSFLDLWAAGLASETGTDPSRIAGAELASDPRLLPLEVPGSASNVVSANGPVLAAVNALYAAHGEKIDIVAASEGALAARWLLKNNPTARAKVAGLVSLGGVNAGGEYAPEGLAAWCGDPDDYDQWLEVCREVFYLPAEGPGGTAFLRALNGGDPTPGTLAYYHVYTESLPPDGATHAEALEPYGWGVPLLGATNVSAQEACAPHGYGSRMAPHAALWSVFPVIEWDSVQTELVLDALHRRTPAIDAASTCAGR